MYFVKEALKINPLKTDDWTTNTNSEFFFIKLIIQTQRAYRRHYGAKDSPSLRATVQWHSVKWQTTFSEDRRSICSSKREYRRRSECINSKMISSSLDVALMYSSKASTRWGNSSKKQVSQSSFSYKCLEKRVISRDCGTNWPPRTRFWQGMISFYWFISKKNFMLTSFRFFNIWNTTFGQNSDHYSLEH